MPHLRFIVVLAVVLALLVVPLALPQSAFAGPVEKGVNTASNLGLGWTNCGKALADEGMKAKKSVVRGAASVVTGPFMCGVNVGVTYALVPVDAATVAWGSNALPPAAHSSLAPPIRLPH